VGQSAENAEEFWAERGLEKPNWHTSQGRIFHASGSVSRNISGRVVGIAGLHSAEHVRTGTSAGMDLYPLLAKRLAALTGSHGNFTNIAMPR
jgi:hypothetical protein